MDETYHYCCESTGFQVMTFPRVRRVRDCAWAPTCSARDGGGGVCAEHQRRQVAAYLPWQAGLVCDNRVNSLKFESVLSLAFRSSLWVLIS